MSQLKRKLIIDTDAGMDDAQAIIMALSDDRIEIVAITTVCGNTDVENVIKNVYRTLKLCGRLDVPVYRGCCRNLIGIRSCVDFLYHGEDGFGDADFKSTDEELLGLKKTPAYLSNEHASNALVRLINGTAESSIELLCLGPLTNIALALHLDPSLGKRLQHCYIMGGNYKGYGNTTAMAEYNFYMDPEAAQFVLSTIECAKTLVCWELCVDSALPWNKYNYVHANGTVKSNFMRHIESNVMKIYHQDKKGYIMADQLIVAIVLDRVHDFSSETYKEIVSSKKEVFIRVALTGECRGQLMVDWDNLDARKQLKQWSVATIITTLDVDKLTDLLYTLMQ